MAFITIAVQALPIAIAWATDGSQRIQFAGETLEL